MTPAIDLANQHGIAFTVHEYSHDPDATAYGLEAAEKLGVDPERLFKTLVLETDTRQLVVGVVPVSQQLNEKLMAKAVRAKRVQMAAPDKVARSSGYVLGGVSPLGQKRSLPTRIHATARDWPTVYVSAGRRGLQIELLPEDLRRLTGGEFAALCR